MNKELELWQFIDERLKKGESVMLLVVAESSGSSPGRHGYKMAVGADGELFGSIGGGVMEVNLVEESRRLLSAPPAVAGGLREQVHRRNNPKASGMICSGEQTVISFRLLQEHLGTTESVVRSLRLGEEVLVKITNKALQITPPATAGGTDKKLDTTFQKHNEKEFVYTESLGFANDLYIIGGGHCALALSELMSKMDFRISLFDDRPDLNTIEKNRFAHEVTIVDGYENIAAHVPTGSNSYVVVMTLGYRTDAVVIRSLIDHEFRYFGVLGSNAKMSSMFKEFIKEGMPAEKLDRIRTPVGIAINSRTPEEIAVSIAAEIISVKNSA
jgi:xanthine dehydrogenase accessory factor